MLKQRRQAAERVAAEFLKLEAVADEAALLGANCISIMLEQRAAANLPVGTGLDAITMVMDATSDLVAARRKLIEAHAALVLVREGIGIRSFGDSSECPKVADGGHLRVVA